MYSTYWGLYNLDDMVFMLIIFVNNILYDLTIWKNIIMEQDIKTSPFKKDKIFNVRKLPYKQFDNQKYLHQYQSKQPFQELQNSHHAMEYHYQIMLTSTKAYKELHRRYREKKQLQKRQKQQKMHILRQKEQQLHLYIADRIRLEQEREALLKKRDQLREYIHHLRLRNEEIYLQATRNQQYEINMEQMRHAIMQLRYQGGVDIDVDNMTYEELLQLQQKIGKVSKGLTEEQLGTISRKMAKKQQENDVCSICYYNLKEGEQINELWCRHVFHCDCIKQWLQKEKTCPLCKQEYKIQLS